MFFYRVLGNLKNGRPEKTVEILDVREVSWENRRRPFQSWKSPGPRVAWRRGTGMDPEPEKILKRSEKTLEGQQLDEVWKGYRERTKDSIKMT